MGDESGALQGPTGALVGPSRMQDDAAHIPTLERRVLEGEEIIIERSERAVRPMLQPFVERIDNGVLEVGFARPRCRHGIAFGVGELIVGTAGHVHACCDV